MERLPQSDCSQCGLVRLVRVTDGTIHCVPRFFSRNWPSSEYKQITADQCDNSAAHLDYLLEAISD